MGQTYQNLQPSLNNTLLAVICGLYVGITDPSVSVHWSPAVKRNSSFSLSLVVQQHNAASQVYLVEMPLTSSPTCVVVCGFSIFLTFLRAAVKPALWCLAGLDCHECPRVLWCAVHSGPSLLKLGTRGTGSKEEGFGRMETLCSRTLDQVWITLDTDSFNYFNFGWHSEPKVTPCFVHSTQI